VTDKSLIPQLQFLLRSIVGLAMLNHLFM